MKTQTITIKGAANIASSKFAENLNKYISENLKGHNELNGYKSLSMFDTLKGKNATEKVIIKGKYWRNSWTGYTTEIHSIFYK